MGKYQIGREVELPGCSGAIYLQLNSVLKKSADSRTEGGLR